MGRRKWKFDADMRAMAAEYYCRKNGWSFKRDDIRAVMFEPPDYVPKFLTPECRRILAAVRILNAIYEGGE